MSLKRVHSDVESPPNALRHSLSRFAFIASPTSTRYSRHCVSVKDGVTCQVHKDLEPEVKSPKGKGRKEALDESSPKKKRRVLKREYAKPETYAHLHALNDHLGSSLDVLFCGINPGCMSATKGHHYANPTNHFWKALHLSGFTPRLLSPSEDATIPSCYSLGLTNLVERPSAEEAELSKEEMKQSVPSLAAKIANSRPLIVCFVGKGIWLIVEAVFKKQLLDEGPGPIKNGKRTDDVAMQEAGVSLLISSATRRVESENSKTTRRPREVPKTFDWGLQPYKLVYPDSHATGIREGPGDSELLKSAPTNETVFFVMPSTSARVVSHQLADKVKLFSRLRNDLERVKSKTLDTSSMTVVPLIQ